MNDIIMQYDNGDITPQQALRALCSELGECTSTIEPLEVEQKQLRAAIEKIISKEGTQEIRGFGRMSIVPPSTQARYDTKQLDKLVLDLMQLGEYEIASKVAECKRETVKSSFLKIERER